VKKENSGLLTRRKAIQLLGGSTLAAAIPLPISAIQQFSDVQSGKEIKNERSLKKRRYFAYRSFMPEYETMKRFREIGVDTFTFMVSNNENLLGLPYTKYQPTWIWERKYDFTLFDKNVHDILNAVPDAQLLCFIDLNPPTWWVRRGGRHGQRFDPYYDLGRIASSTEWKEDTSHYLQSLLIHSEKVFSKTIKAYIIGGGTTTEWFDSSCGAESIYRLEGFRRYMKLHGKAEPLNVPPLSIRYHGSRDMDDIDKIYRNYHPETEYLGVRNKPSGMFRTPEENELALDYWRFNNEQIADAVEYLIKKAHEVVSPETELGILFGYMTDIGQFMRATMGHLDYERIFQMPEVDFALEPISYLGREMGGSSSSMVPNETLKLNGKRLLNSCDHRTYTIRFPMNFPGSENPWKNSFEVSAGIKRETSYNLINDCSTWWFDMWGGWWDSPEAMAAIKKGKEIWDFETKQEQNDVSEILFIVDPDNMYYVNDSRMDCGKFDIPIRKFLNHIGAPHTFCSFNDLKKLDISRYKLLVMCHPFELNDEKMEVLNKRVMNSGRTILWIYGPGIINQGKWDPENVKRICGTAYRTPGINSVKIQNWNSVYVHNTDSLNAELMRNIAEKAGCHIYCDKLRPVYANNRLIAVHTGAAEKLTLTFKEIPRKITELYTEMKFAKSKSITVESKGPETFLFRYE
jgi:hypothetical protein